MRAAYILWPNLTWPSKHAAVRPNASQPHLFNVLRKSSLLAAAASDGGGAQRAKFAKKVHKPPPRFNVINFELNWFDASIWVP